MCVHECSKPSDVKYFVKKGSCHKDTTYGVIFYTMRLQKMKMLIFPMNGSY